ncbi:hypothetical protein [Curtobacterium sp. VKM Ac-2922]|uniref:hypothetical protein n=1 Tax=Curtobacterium sp. VKM Ac-2922 TaxID=2929475 RepID=UPI001FB53DB8|nr:hypothetical protein [Curtobacterium sp. VKM Ac-2922]MCJ1714521.1 hypothetical protein [Curtobacterium sp. VKM Ac-2922]
MSVAVAATIALGATGCEFMSPASTGEIRQITDGVNVSTGKVDVRNALLISDSGKNARFVGTIVNTSADDITLTIEVASVAQTVVVPANSHVDPSSGTAASAESSVQSGAETQGTRAAGTDAVVFRGADVTPGSLVKVYFSYAGAEGVSANVPVLTSALEEYNTLAPTSTPTPTRTAESGETSEPTDTPTATPAG